jgi:hypothetical protein
MFYFPGVVFSLLSCRTHPFFLHPFPDDNSKTKSFPCKGLDLAKSNSSWWTGQTLVLYSMFCSFWSSWPCKELLIERFNKIGDLKFICCKCTLPFKTGAWQWCWVVTSKAKADLILSRETREPTWPRMTRSSMCVFRRNQRRFPEDFMRKSPTYKPCDFMDCFAFCWIRV